MDFYQRRLLLPLCFLFFFGDLPRDTLSCFTWSFHFIYFWRRRRKTSHHELRPTTSCHVRLQTAPRRRAADGQTYLAGHHATLSFTRPYLYRFTLMTKGRNLIGREKKPGGTRREDGIVYGRNRILYIGSNTCCNGTNCKERGASRAVGARDTPAKGRD